MARSVGLLILHTTTKICEEILIAHTGQGALWAALGERSCLRVHLKNFAGVRVVLLTDRTEFNFKSERSKTVGHGKRS